MYTCGTSYTEQGPLYHLVGPTSLSPTTSSLSCQVVFLPMCANNQKKPIFYNSTNADAFIRNTPNTRRDYICGPIWFKRKHSRCQEY